MGLPELLGGRVCLLLLVLLGQLECPARHPQVAGARAPALQHRNAAPPQPALSDPLPEVSAGPDAVLCHDDDSSVHRKLDLTG